ncbi:MAG: hypothetical protein ACOC10_04375, partial [Bacteroidota bacterium]
MLKIKAMVASKRLKLIFINVLLTLVTVSTAFPQEIPLVYEVENTGADCPQPPLPSIDELPVIDPLPDPFAWSDGSGRDTTFESWQCRRAEIMAEIEHYEIGKIPGKTDTIIASFSDGVLSIILIENDDTLTLTSEITLPEGEG